MGFNSVFKGLNRWMMIQIVFLISESPQTPKALKISGKM